MKLKIEKKKVQNNWLKDINDNNDYLSFLVNAFEGMHIITTIKEEKDKLTQLKALSLKRLIHDKFNYNQIIDAYILPQNSEQIYKIQKKGKNLGLNIIRDMKIHDGEMYQIDKDKKQVKIFGQPISYHLEQYKDKKESKNWLEKCEEVYPFRTQFSFSNQKLINVYFKNMIDMNMVVNYFICKKVEKYKKVLNYLSNQFSIQLSISLLEQIGLYQIKINPNFQRKQMLTLDDIIQDPFKTYNSLIFNFDRYALNHLMTMWDKKSQARIKDKNAYNLLLQTDNSPKVGQLSHIVEVNNEISFNEQKKNFKNHIETFLNYDKLKIKEYLQIWKIKSEREHTIQEKKNFSILIQINQLLIDSSTYIIQPQISIKMSEKIRIYKGKTTTNQDEEEDNQSSIDCEEQYQMTNFNTTGKQFNAELKLKQQNFMVFDLAPSQLLFKEQENTIIFQNVDINQQILLDLTDKSQIIDNKYKQKHKISIHDILDQNFSSKVMMVSLKEKQIKQNLTEKQPLINKPSYLNIQIEFKKKQEEKKETKLNFLQKNQRITFNDPYYVDKIILPEISMETLPIMLEYMKEKDEHYLDFIDNIAFYFNSAFNHTLANKIQEDLIKQINFQLQILHSDITEQIELNQLMQKELENIQINQDQNMVFLNQLIRSIFINDYRQSQNIKEILKKYSQVGFSHNYRQILWYNLFNIPSQFTDERTFLQELNLYKDDYLLAEKPEAIRLYFSIADTNTSINEDNKKYLFELLLQQESYKCLTTLLKSQVEKLLINFLKWTELKQINPSFIKQNLIFTVRIGLKIASMNNYFYICKKQKKFYDETQSFIMAQEGDDVSINEENALNFWLLINMLKIIKGLDENQYMEQLQKTCLFLKLFMKQICPNILDKISDLYYQTEYFFNHIFRDLFSSILSSEYLYRLWDYMIFNYAIEQQQIPFFLCAVLLTILQRMQKKVKMIIDIIDFAHIFRMETILIGNTKIFHGEIQENLKKIKLFFSQDKNLIQYIESQIKNISLIELSSLNFNILEPQEQNMVQQTKFEQNPFQKIKQQQLIVDFDENKKQDGYIQKKQPQEQKKNTFMDQVQKAIKELGIQNTKELPEDEIYDDKIIFGSPKTKLNQNIEKEQNKKFKLQKLFKEKKLVNNLQTVQIREQQLLQNKIVQLIDSQNSSFTLSLQQLQKQYNTISIHDHNIDQLRNINQTDHSKKLYHLIIQSLQKFTVAEKLIAFLVEQRKYFLEVVKTLQDLIILEVEDMKFINIKTDTKLIEDIDLGKEQAQLQQDLHIYQSFFLKCYTSINIFKNVIEYNDDWKIKVDNIAIVKNQEFNKFSYGLIQNIQQQLFSLKEIINGCSNYQDEQTNQIQFEQFQLKSIFETLQKQNNFFNNSQNIFKCLFHSFADDISSILKICQENHHQYFIVSNDFKKCADEVKNMSKIRDHRIIQLEFEVIQIKQQFLNFKFPYNRVFNSEIISQCGIQLKNLKNQHDEQVQEIINYTKDQSSFFFELRKLIGKRQLKKLREVALEIKLLQIILLKVIEVEKYEKNLERLISQRQYFQDESILLDDFDKKIFFFSEQLELISLDKEQVKGFLYFLPQLRNFHQRMENEHMYCQSYMELLDDYFQNSTDNFDQEKLNQLNKLIESAQEFQNQCIQDLKKLMQTVHWFQKNLETVDDYLTQLCIYKVLRKQPIQHILRAKKIYDELKELKEAIADKLNKLLSQKLLSSKSRQEIVQSMNITTENVQIYQFIADLKLVIQINQQVKYEKSKQEILTDVQLICDYIIILKNNYEMFIDIYKDKSKTGKILKEELDQIICDLDMKIFSFEQRQFFQDLEVSIENYKKRTLQAFEQRVNQKKIKVKQEKVEIDHELIEASEQNMNILKQVYFQFDQVMEILSKDYDQINVLISQIKKLNEYVQQSQTAYIALVKVQMHIADQDIKLSIENMIILEEIVKKIKIIQEFTELIEKIQDGFLNPNVSILNTAQMLDQINSQKDRLSIDPILSQKIPQELQDTILKIFNYSRNFISNINYIWNKQYLKILQNLEIQKQKIPVKKVELFNIKFCQVYDDYVNFILTSIALTQTFSTQFIQKDEFVNKWMQNLNNYIISQKEQISGNLSDQCLIQLRDNLISLTDYQLSEITKNTVDLMSKLKSPVAKDILFGDIKTLITYVFTKITNLKSNIFVDKIPDEINQNLQEIVNKQQLQERLEKIHMKGWLYVCEIFNEFYKVVQNQSQIDSSKDLINNLLKQLTDEQNLQDLTIQSVIDDIIKLFKKILK